MIHYSIRTGVKKIKTKTTIALTGVALVLAGSAMSLGVPFGASAAPAPKATGGIGYSAYGLQRYATFEAQQTSVTCGSTWNVTGNYNLSFNLTGDLTPYVHDASLTQTGNNLSGTGGYPAGGPHVYEWLLTSGTVNNTSVNFTADYTMGADALVPPTTMNVTGTIAPDGSMSGAWNDNYQGGTRNGQWHSTSGHAVQVSNGCTGKGNFNYSDVNGNYYAVDVQYVKVSGNQTWFAGPVVSGNVGAGQWLFAKVQDLGTPGSKGDLVSGSFATEAAAKLGVANMTNPSDGPFAVTSGNLVVH